MTVGVDVRVDQARLAIQRVDPEKSLDAVNAMLCAGCGVKQSELPADGVPVMASLFMERLSQTWQVRSTRRNRAALTATAVAEPPQ